MSHVAELRARIAARRVQDVARVPICIDRDQAEQIADLEERLNDLNAQRLRTLNEQKDGQRRGDVRLGDSPVAKIDTEIKTVTADLNTAWAAADDSTMIVILGLLPPEGDGSWQELLDKYADQFTDDAPPDGWCSDIITACFRRAETVDGEDLGMPWVEVRESLNHGDRERLWRKAMIHNRQSASLDFSKRRSATRRRAAK